MRLRSYYWIGTLGTSCLLVVPLDGQAPVPPSWEVHADNDYFNFWQAAGKRPDWDYTQGAELSGTWSGRAFLLPRILPGRSPCSIGQTVDQPCTRLRLAIGQEIYTPEIESPHLLPGQRPFAGWLYTRLSESAESRNGLDELSVSVGITGPPSLAETVQATWHRWFDFPDPVGWTAQLPFEPDVAVSWTRARELVPRGSAIANFLHVAPIGVAEIGSLATTVTAGANVTIGINPPSAWQATLRRTMAAKAGFYLGGGGQVEYVARNLFLDGNTFRPSSSVAKEPFIGQLSWTVGLSLGRVRLEWTAIHLTREYRTQPMPHAYSRLLVRIE